eukprot:TRINITY_DN4086_c0_g1_i1.p1 TRINITY_DN4086_c0_g1~~TRINITY_DN4086_c0_g1_i1.p1  ORF type:complete len:452 (-),score=84.84 TRINITY_DN4086_c0_g1_i1:58-1413(-)
MAPILWISSKSVLRVLLTAFTGGITQKYFFSNRKKSLRDLSQLVGKLLLPSMILAQLAENLTWEELKDSYMVPLYCLAYIGIGLTLGKIVSYFVKDVDKPMVMLLIGFSNSTGVPLPIVSSLSTDLDWMKNSQARNYIFLLCGIMAGGLWSLGWYIYNRTMKVNGIIPETEGNLPITMKDTHQPSTNADNNVNIKDTNHTKTTTNNSYQQQNSTNDDKCNVNTNNDKKMTDSQDEVGSQDYNCNSSSISKETKPEDISINVVSKNPKKPNTIAQIWKSIRQCKFFTPPLMGTCIGVIIGIVGFLHTFFIDDDQPGYIMFSVIKLFGQACIPIILTILGSNFLEKPDLNQGNIIKKKLIVLICAARLIIMPIIGVCLVQLGVKIGFLDEENLIMRFVLMLQSCTPTSMTAIAIVQLSGGNKKNISIVLYCMYLSAIVTVTLWNAYFVWLLDY